MDNFYTRFTGVEERKFYADLEAQTSRIKSYETVATPSLSQTVGDLYKKYEGANPGVLLAVANGIENGLMTSDLADKLIPETMLSDMEETASYGIGGRDGKTSWYERNVFNNLKTASRWTTAGLNFSYDLATNVGAALVGVDNPFKEGWFISTQLGTLLENSDEAGYGWFLGGKAWEKQAERAREFRGTIDGRAWTPGRAVANVFFQPDHDVNAVAEGLENAAFNILSGTVDAMFALKTPALPGIGKVADLAGSFKGAAGLRVVDGLATWESPAIIPGKVARWMDTRSGQKVIDFLANRVNTVDEAIAVFPNSNSVWWQNVIEAKTPKAVRELLEEGLGLRDPSRGIGPRRIQDFNVSSWNGLKMRINQSDSYIPRVFNYLIRPTYEQDVVLAFGNERDVAQSLKNLSNSMVAFGVKAERRQELLGEFLDAYNQNRGALGGLSKQYRNIMEESLTAHGVPPEAVKQMLDGWIEFGRNIKFGANKMADNQIVSDNFGAEFFDETGALAHGPFSTAAILPEVAKHTLVLPDPRRVRRVMNEDPVFKHMFGTTGWAFGRVEKVSGKIGKVVKKDITFGKGWFDPADYGKQRLPFAAIEALQQEIWRPFILMTGGYAVRNMTDSALRLRMRADLSRGAFHPLDYIMLAMNKKAFGDIEGMDFDTARKTILQAKDEYGEAVNASLRELDPRAVAAQERWTGLWEFAPRGNTQEFIKGVADEVGLLASDEIAKMIAAGDDTTEILDFLQNNPRGQRIVRDLQEMWRNVELTPVNGGPSRIGTIDFTGPRAKDNLIFYIEKYLAPRIRETTGGNQSLIDVIANNEFIDATGQTRKAFNATANGNFYGNTDEFYDEVARLVADPGSNLKDVYKRRVELDPRKIRRQGVKRPGVKRVAETADHLVDSFFAHLFTKNEAILNRSPAFRRFYYNEVGTLFDLLEPGSARTLRNRILNVAKERKVDVSTTRKANKFIEKYVGDKPLARRIINAASGKADTTGQRTLDEIDSIAKGYALDSTRELFYNASSRSNFTDILRIIAPFGGAWAEVMRSWSKIATANPNNLKKAAVSVRGLRDSGVEGEGKGFFYRNPTNGEYYFNVPWSRELAPFFGGYVGGGLGFLTAGVPGAIVGAAALGGGGAAISTQLGDVSPVASIPAKSLNMGTQIVPGFGPVVQIAATQILGAYPKYDDFVDLLAPYGSPGLSQLFPAWLQKFADAVQADPESSRVFGDIYIETLAALSTTGKYDLTDQNDVLKMDNDAKDKAKWLLILRSFGQFIGPGRPEIDFKIETEQGDVIATELSRIYYDMRDKNPSTATLDFLNIFGDDVFMYITGKTRSNVSGLEATNDFGNWERDNLDFKATYPDSYAWFAPDGSIFDFRVWSRQMQTGERERMSGRERLDMAQQILGRALVRDAQSKMPDDPTDEQEQWLKDTKAAVEQLLPGYKKRDININVTYAAIADLTEAANDPMVDDEPVAKALRAYFAERDRFIQEAIEIHDLSGEKSLKTAKKMKYAREELRSLALSLIDMYPTFARVYDSVLSYEVED